MANDENLVAEVTALPFKPVELDDVKDLTLFEYFLQLSFHTSDLHVTRAFSLCPKETDLDFINSNIQALDGSVVSVWMDFNRMEPPQSYEECLATETLKVDLVSQLYETGCIAPPLGFKGNPTGQFRMMLFRVALGKCLVHHQGQESFMTCEIPQGIDSLELCVNSEPRFYNSLFRISSAKQVLPCLVIEFEFRPVRIDVPEPVCEVCETVPAQWYCPSDKAHFCNSCDTKHHSSTPIFSRHARIPCAKSPVQFGVCEYHPSEIVDLVCTECCIPLCSHCITIGNHSDVSFLSHPLMSTFDAYEYSLKNALEHDEFLVSRLERLSMRIKDRHGILSQVYANFNHAKNQVDTSRNLFIKDLELMKRQKLQYLEALEDEISCQEAQMEWLEKHLGHLLLTLGHADFCSVKKKFDLTIEHMFGTSAPISLDAMPSWVLENLQLVGDAKVTNKSLDVSRLDVGEDLGDGDGDGDDSGRLAFKFNGDKVPCWKPATVFDDWDETLGHCPDERVDVGVDIGQRLETVLSMQNKGWARQRKGGRRLQGEGGATLKDEKEEYDDYDLEDAETIDNETSNSNDLYYSGGTLYNGSKGEFDNGNLTLARLRVEKLWQLLSDGYMITLLTLLKLVAPPERSDLITRACTLASYFDEYDLLLTRALEYEKASISSQGGYCILMRSSCSIFDLAAFACFQGASKDVTLWFNNVVYNNVATSISTLDESVNVKTRAYECATNVTLQLTSIADAVAIPSTIRALVYKLCDAAPPSVATILCIDFLTHAASKYILEHADFGSSAKFEHHLNDFKIHLAYNLSRIGIVAWELAYPVAANVSVGDDNLQVATRLKEWLEVLFKRPRLVSKIHTKSLTMVPHLLEASDFILDTIAKVQEQYNAGTLQVQDSLSSPQYKFLELFKLAATRND